MKKNSLVRVLAMALALVLCLSVVPQRAEAALNLKSFEAFKAGSVIGFRSEESFRRGKRDVYPFEFYSVENSCTGFTLDYEILEVTKGKLSNKNVKFEVYVHLASTDNWKSVEGFYLDDLTATVDVEFDYPMSIDGVAVVCLKEGIEFEDDIVVRNVSNQASSLPTIGALKGSWADKVLKRSNYTTYPFELDSSLTRCKGFTLNYQITEVLKGNLDKNFKCSVYVRTTGGTWKSVCEFKMEPNQMDACVNVRFDPVSIDAVAVYCLRNMELVYSHNFTITDPV